VAMGALKSCRPTTGIVFMARGQRGSSGAGVNVMANPTGRAPGSTSRRIARLLLAPTTLLGVLTFFPETASASRFPQTAYAGRAECSLSGRLSFIVPTASSGGGIDQLRAQLRGCHLSKESLFLSRVPSSGRMVVTLASSPFDCATLSATQPQMGGTVNWPGVFSVETGNGPKDRTMWPTYLYEGTRTTTTGSFWGGAEINLNVPPTLAHLCANPGLKRLRVTGTAILGPSCGPGTGAVTIYRLAPGTVCGGIYGPGDITTGPDGALWFTNTGDESIGRITTAGIVTIYPTGQFGPTSITAGPDGALWFTDAASFIVNGSATGGSIGRMTTSGQTTFYPIASGDPGDITVGPDGALWFTVDPPPLTSEQGWIGRITTSGTLTTYTDSAINWPLALTSGPDGALWFTNLKAPAIGRITTSGIVTVSYSDPSVIDPMSIATGSDGALWFTTPSFVDRVSTSGSFTHFADPSQGALSDVAPGPDGALWFATTESPIDETASIARMTTSGSVTTYDSPGVYGNTITAGPDGAMWFKNGNDTIGRIAVP
jgi:virginiamycin B lyase